MVDQAELAKALRRLREGALLQPQDRRVLLRQLRSDRLHRATCRAEERLLDVEGSPHP